MDRTHGYFSEDQNPVLLDVSASQTGTYSAVGIVSGCATYPKHVFISVRDPQVSLPADTTFCPETPWRIHLDAGDAITYRWDDGSHAPSREVNAGREYWIEVRDDINCTDSDTMFVTENAPSEIFFPNAFSPNDDNINDVFRPVPSDVTDYELVIFNRWGKLIFGLKTQMKGGTGNSRAAM